LIADEPTGNLDSSYAADIMGIFQDFNQVGVTVIVATHDARGMSATQNRVLHLDHGSLAVSNSVESMNA
jgi:cell division transport system ATP-binding protein